MPLSTANMLAAPDHSQYVWAAYFAAALVLGGMAFYTWRKSRAARSLQQRLDSSSTGNRE